MRTSTLSSVTKHVGANTTAKALPLVRSGILASQSDEEFDKAYGLGCYGAYPPWKRLQSAPLWFCVSGIEAGGSQEARLKVVMISYEFG